MIDIPIARWCQMGLRGIKSRVFVQFWILFLLSALFLDVLLMFFFLERTISHFTEQKRFSLTVVCENIQGLDYFQGHSKKNKKSIAFPQNDPFFFTEISQLPPNRDGFRRPANTLESLVFETLRSGQALTRKVGAHVGWLLLQHKAVIITHPVVENGKTIAAGGIECSLGPVYHDFLRIQKILLLFVLINSCFFALIGNRQLSRIYFRPLKRLAKRAETYQDDGSLLFSVRKEDNEFSILSSALNKMLDRITEDKRVLKETIDSLQTANRELQKAQNDVIRAEKLATVGRLTSGIAHEIGNPIGIVLGYLDLLKQSDLSPDERNDFIGRSENEITRINHIIRQLLDMSRTSPGEAKTISIHLLLNDLIAVFNFQPTADQIHFESRFDASKDRVRADPDRLRQVFLNILLNAIDALNADLSTRAKILLMTVNPTTDAKADSIEIIIQDNGPGIPSSHLSQIFDPFFTTKQPGKGTGLGLSVSFMIIEQLGGHMSATSSENNGAAFRVILPLAGAAQEANIDTPAG